VAQINSQPLDLSAREVGLLEVLLSRMGRLVSKEGSPCGWGEEVSHNAIEVYVHRLRKKIEPGGVKIATVRGLGYCLERPKASNPSCRIRNRALAVWRDSRLDAGALAVRLAAEHCLYALLRQQRRQFPLRPGPARARRGDCPSGQAGQWQTVLVLPASTRALLRADETDSVYFHVIT
jgi:hypothetical protein